jgi:hypothetical protein
MISIGHGVVLFAVQLKMDCSWFVGGCLGCIDVTQPFYFSGVRRAAAVHCIHGTVILC